MGMDPKVSDLARRVKLNLEQLGVTVQVPEEGKNRPGIRQYCDRVLQGILREIFLMY